MILYMNFLGVTTYARSAKVMVTEPVGQLQHVLQNIIKEVNNLYLSHSLANNTVNHTVLNIAYFIFLMKDHPDYDDSVCHAFVHDICEEMASFPFPPQSLDVILAVFVLSSIHPERQVKVTTQRQENPLSFITCQPRPQPPPQPL